MPSDSSEVDSAVVSRLIGDSQLSTLMPGGVFFDIAGSGKTQFVIVSQLAHNDEPMFGGAAYERFLYLVKAVELATAGANVKAAAARIHTVLHGAQFAITGYGLMVCRRVERVRYTEVDEADSDKRWQHRGGQYELVASPN